MHMQNKLIRLNLFVYPPSFISEAHEVWQSELCLKPCYFPLPLFAHPITKLSSLCKSCELKKLWTLSLFRVNVCYRQEVCRWAPPYSFSQGIVQGLHHGRSAKSRRIVGRSSEQAECEVQPHPPRRHRGSQLYHCLHLLRWRPVHELGTPRPPRRAVRQATKEAVVGHLQELSIASLKSAFWPYWNVLCLKDVCTVSLAYSFL